MTTTLDRCTGPARLLIIPGLRDSGPTHWQSWLEHQERGRGALRVVQRNFAQPDLLRWAARIQSTIAHATEREGRSEWIAVAHSFGALALARHLADEPDSPIRQALFVAPAEPDKFGLAELLPHRGVGRPCTLIASQNDPWMSATSALRWAGRWHASFINLGAVGHINSESGFGPFPLARRWLDAARARAAKERREPDELFLSAA